MAEEGMEVRKVYHPTGGRLMVKQAPREHTDINFIVNRWRQTGYVQGSGKEPRYGDFSAGLDYHACLNHVRDAEDSFMRLPARVRSYCENDAGKFLDLCEDPERIKEMEALGLLEAQMPEKALLVRMESVTEASEKADKKADDSVESA